MNLISRIIPFFSTENSPEYIKRTQTPYAHPTANYHDIQAAIPAHMHKRHLGKGLWLAGRDFIVIAAFVTSAVYFETVSETIAGFITSPDSPTLFAAAKYAIKMPLWGAYWFLMGAQGAGVWFNGHEAGHGALTEYNWLNDTLGLFLHMVVLNPYFSWKISHKMHHKGSAHMEREENYVPVTRSQYIGDHPEVAGKLRSITPDDHRIAEEQAKAREQTTGSRFSIVYDAIEEVPLVMLWARFAFLVTFGWNGYIGINVNGNRNRGYGPYTSHFDPWSDLFQSHQAPYIILSDVSCLVMAYCLASVGQIYGFWNLFVFWGIPYLATNFFLTWITVLQHSDATVPHFRSEEWTYFKGNLATIDRPFLGWMGKFFIHNAGHAHVGHHLFPQMPCYTLPEATKIFAPMLGDSYVYDSSPTLWALWRTFHECQFVEDEGGILFYRDRVGVARRGLAPELLDSQRGIVHRVLDHKTD